MKLVIQLLLGALAVVMAYLIYNSIDSRIKFEEEIAKRNEVVSEHLEYIKQAQIAFKDVKKKYAGSFEELTHFLQNDSLVFVKAIGEVPDSLLGNEAKALELGIIVRDTSLIAVKDTLFKPNFNKIVESLPYIPFTDGEKFSIKADQIEKSGLQVSVFEVVATNEQIYKGLDTKNEDVDLEDGYRLGSLDNPTTNISKLSQ